MKFSASGSSPALSMWEKVYLQPPGLHLVNRNDWGNAEVTSVFQSVTYVLIITHICGEINAEKAIPSLMESMWKPHFLKGFFSGKKKKVLSQLWLWIVKYSTDTASRNNGAANQERLQKPQGEEDVAM